MSLGGLLSLKWNNHCSTFLHILSTLHRKQSYDDATVACDGKLYPVHKLVLSTCSEYFEEMFEKTQGKHPVIVLKDIKKEVFEALLKYMYIGEVNVVQEKLAELINAAECLKIKGLAVPDEEPEPHSHSTANKNKSSTHASSSSNHSLADKESTHQSCGRSARASTTNSLSTKRKENQSFHSSNAPPRKILRGSNETLRSAAPAESSAKDDGTESLSFASTLELPRSGETRENRSSLDERTSTSSSLTNNEENDVTVWPSAVKEEPVDSAPDDVNASSGGVSELVDDVLLGASQNITNNSDADGGGGSGHNEVDAAEQDTNDEVHGEDGGTELTSSAPQSEEKNEESSAEPNNDQQEVMTSKVEVEESSDDWEGVLIEKGDGDDAEALNSMLSGDDASNTAGDDKTSGWPSCARSISPSHHHNDGTRPLSSDEAANAPQLDPDPQLTHLDSEAQQPAAGGCPALLGAEKRFQCPACPYATHKKDHFTKHVRTHTGEKPFSCAHCQYRSANKANLDRHARLHVEMTRFECGWCSFSSWSSEELELHHSSAHSRGFSLDGSAA